MWNPLRTLAGRLILVTVIAIAMSHAFAAALFLNERVTSLRRVSETAAAERIAFAAQRLRAAPAELRQLMARSVRDFGIRYRVAETPSLPRSDGDAGSRLAQLVAEELGGVDVRARTRVIDLDRPFRARVRGMLRDTEQQSRDPDAPPEPPGGTPGSTPGPMPDPMSGPQPGPQFGSSPMPGPPGAEPGLGPPPDSPGARRDDRGPPGRRANAVFTLFSDDAPRAVDATVVIALGPSSWLEARTLLPAPRTLPRSLLYAALASMLAVSFGAVLVARQISRPLAGLAGAARKLGAGDPNVSVPESGPDDVRVASRAFNDMAARLGRQLARQRQMLWALSHDLRTPITALRLRAELIEDESARQKWLQPLADMQTLTEQALALARAGASGETRTRVDLAEIARTLCGELSEIGLPVRAEADAQVYAECRPDEIARAMRNLAENAARYAGGGVMRVTRRDDGAAVVEMLDDGPGLKPEDLARVVEPFYRADPARSAEANADGAGLGLAIAQAIIDGHGGRLVLENRAPHGLAARLILPGPA